MLGHYRSTDYRRGHLLLRLLQLLPNNAHAITALPLQPSSSVDFVTNAIVQDIGSGIYATLSLFNHSCFPNVMRQNLTDHCIVVRAQRRIPNGQPIADNYSALSATMNKSDRRRHLALGYQFTCRCVECDVDTAMFADLAEMPPVWRCPSCHRAMQSRSDRLMCCSADCSYSVAGNCPELVEQLERLGDFDTLSDLIHRDVSAVETKVISLMAEVQATFMRPSMHEYALIEFLKQCLNIRSQSYQVISIPFHKMPLPNPSLP